MPGAGGREKRGLAVHRVQSFRHTSSRDALHNTVLTAHRHCALRNVFRGKISCYRIFIMIKEMLEITAEDDRQ